MLDPQNPEAIPEAGLVPMFNAVIVIVMLGIIISLGSGLVFLVRDEGKTNRTVASLAVRVALSVVLLVLLAVGFAAKFLTPAA